MRQLGHGLIGASMGKRNCGHNGTNCSREGAQSIEERSLYHNSPILAAVASIPSSALENSCSIPLSHFRPAWAHTDTKSDASTSRTEGTMRASPWCRAPERCSSDHCSNPLAVFLHPASEAPHGEDEPHVGYFYLTPG